MKKIIILAVFLLVAFHLSAQEDSTWKPQLNFTGYINGLLESTDLQNWKDAKKDFGIGLSEAAFLVSYKPLKKLEFKGTFVYTKYVPDLQAAIVEAFGTYTVNRQFKISIGKYLTPLSPVNQYFYAPMNPSATLPMLISHHFMLPQSITGLQISGEFGRTIKAGYNITYGQYLSIGHYKQGVIGLQGIEDFATTVVDYPKPQAESMLGGSARIYANYNDKIKVGLNYFDGRRATYNYQLITGNPSLTNASKYSIGADAQIKFGNLKINAEYWIAKLKTTDLEKEIHKDYKAFYGEAIYEAGIFSPYFRYEYLDDVKSSIYTSFPDQPLFDMVFKTSTYTAGIAIRPIYEVLVKLEYRNIHLDYDDNPYKIPTKSYNHFIFSLVYSF